MDLLYTWKDVERKMKKYLCDEDTSSIVNIDVYTDEIVITVDELQKKEKAYLELKNIFGKNYNESQRTIVLDKFNTEIRVIIDVDEYAKKKVKVTPLFSNVVYKKKSYEDDILNNEDLNDCPVIAFHSYKGGVGRTLSLLAFAKAWSANNPSKKLLIVDSDIEAPGITWLMRDMNTECDAFCYFDLLELIQSDEIEEKNVLDNVIDLIRESVMEIDTGKVRVRHMVLPTYRYEEQLLDVYSEPQSIAKSYKRKYALAEKLSEIGQKAGASAVLVDLRAGISETSAPLIFDPRVKKYIVTSTSFQSVQGTKMLLRQICKGLPIAENSIVPEVLLTMIPDGLDTTQIKSSLLEEYDVAENNISYTDSIITELPFASELIHLSSFQQIMKKLEEREMYKNINDFVMNRYGTTMATDEGIKNREAVVQEINQLAEKQVVAEGNGQVAVLLTQPISNLIRKYTDVVPQAVILGAKGSGKTFLYKKMICEKTWQSFMGNFGTVRNIPDTYILPLISPKNIAEIQESITETVNENFEKLKGIMGENKLYWYDNVSKVERFVQEKRDKVDWVVFWLESIKNVFHDGKSLEKIDNELQNANQRVLFLVDGLEEILQNTFDNENERYAIQGLIQDVITDLQIKYKNIGLLVFLRNDLANNSIRTNYEQFEKQYLSIALKWSHEEALRLALWLVIKAVPDFCQPIDFDHISQEIVEKELNRLWGVKLGKINSNEAYSSRWILAALSDFNSQLQARDIIRFLQYATENVGREVYTDRYIMPVEIKKAVQRCSKDKIKEIKQEMAALQPIFKKIEDAPDEMKILPFHADTFNWDKNQEKLLSQEGFLIIDNGKYYLPEIIRHALKFKYEKGARPKVLSLLLKNKQ